MRVIAPPGVFRPRSDTWLLAEVVRRHVLPGSRVLDVCAGSGAIALTAARAGAAEIVAVDISRRSLMAVRLNSFLNGVSVETHRGDLFFPVAGRRFDLIVSNPPYLPSGPALPESGPQRAWEAGPEGRAFIERIARDAPRHLQPGGALLIVHSSVCGTEATRQALREAGLVPEVVERMRGPVGPLLRERRPDLGEEELIVFRGSSIEIPALGV